MKGRKRTKGAKVSKDGPPMEQMGETHEGSVSDIDHKKVGDKRGHKAMKMRRGES